MPEHELRFKHTSTMCALEVLNGLIHITSNFTAEALISLPAMLKALWRFVDVSALDDTCHSSRVPIDRFGCRATTCLLPIL